MSTEKLANLLVQARYESIPEEVVEMAKKCILDFLGVALPGSQVPAGRIITEYVKEKQDKPEAGVIAGGFKAAVEHAALANGTMSHVLDYDDYSIIWFGHPTVTVFPAVLALGERDSDRARTCWRHMSMAGRWGLFSAKFWPAG